MSLASPIIKNKNVVLLCALLPCIVFSSVVATHITVNELLEIYSTPLY